MKELLEVLSYTDYKTKQDAEEEVDADLDEEEEVGIILSKY